MSLGKVSVRTLPHLTAQGEFWATRTAETGTAKQPRTAANMSSHIFSLKMFAPPKFAMIETVGSRVVLAAVWVFKHKGHSRPIRLSQRSEWQYELNRESGAARGRPCNILILVEHVECGLSLGPELQMEDLERLEDSKRLEQEAVCSSYYNGRRGYLEGCVM